MASLVSRLAPTWIAPFPVEELPGLLQCIFPQGAEHPVCSHVRSGRAASWPPSQNAAQDNGYVARVCCRLPPI